MTKISTYGLRYLDSHAGFISEASFRRFYEKNELYKIFIQQALLSVVILSKFETDKLTELLSTYNYPIHLYTKDVTGHRPSSIEEVVTFRHENFYHNKDWMAEMPAKRQLKQWLGERMQT